MYHELTTVTKPHSIWTVSSEQFLNDMLFLQKNGYTALLPRDLEAIARGEKSMPQKPVMVTFDDGYESNALLATSILQATGMKASIALITERVRQPEDEKTEFMTWNQARAMAESGVWELGSHTHDFHQSGIGVKRTEGETETNYIKRVGDDIALSQALILANTGQNCTCFAYPYGLTDAYFASVAKKQGLSVTVTTKHGVSNPDKGLWNLPRMTVTDKQTASLLLSGKNEPIVSDAKWEKVPFAVGNKSIYVNTYIIDGYRYMNLRDLAAVVANTPQSFSVQWMETTRTTWISRGASYTPTGKENTGKLLSFSGVSPAISTLDFDGHQQPLLCYTLLGQNYFKLRDLEQFTTMRFYWDSEKACLSLAS